MALPDIVQSITASDKSPVMWKMLAAACDKISVEYSAASEADKHWRSTAVPGKKEASGNLSPYEGKVILMLKFVALAVRFKSWTPANESFLSSSEPSIFCFLVNPRRLSNEVHHFLPFLWYICQIKKFSNLFARFLLLKILADYSIYSSSPYIWTPYLTDRHTDAEHHANSYCY